MIGGVDRRFCEGFALDRSLALLDSGYRSSRSRCRGTKAAIDKAALAVQTRGTQGQRFDGELHRLAQ